MSSKTRLLLVFKSRKKIKNKISYKTENTTAYNKFIEHAYTTKFIQHVKYNLR